MKRIVKKKMCVGGQGGEAESFVVPKKTRKTLQELDLYLEKQNVVIWSKYLNNHVSFASLINQLTLWVL